MFPLIFFVKLNPRFLDKYIFVKIRRINHMDFIKDVITPIHKFIGITNEFLWGYIL
ncbi:sodium:alanine symporter family protein, partial [Bacillus thuringiensis]